MRQCIHHIVNSQSKGIRSRTNGGAWFIKPVPKVHQVVIVTSNHHHFSLVIKHSVVGGVTARHIVVHGVQVIEFKMGVEDQMIDTQGLIWCYCSGPYYLSWLAF